MRKGKHNLSGTKEYTTWNRMKLRCYGSDERYHTYKENGITVCAEWLNDFNAFYRDMGNAPTSKHSLDRIDNKKGYCKENCRWATQKEQTRNYSRNRLITYNGITKCLTEWAEEYGLNRSGIYNRINNDKWEPAVALDAAIKWRQSKAQH